MYTAEIFFFFICHPSVVVMDSLSNMQQEKSRS